jgi:adenosylcobinamide kinase / adenosylcobinamide-phosphate guanylyltransferase
VFVLGGARSGKSAFAERLAADLGAPVLYVATATPVDAEMADRIRRHRAQRPLDWRTLEVPRDVAAAAQAALGGARTVLVEDLTLLLSNLLVGPAHREPMVDPAAAEQAEARAGQELEGLFALPAHVVLVSNEVGLGLVPEHPVGRLFRDALGRLNQRAAAAADAVYLLVAGLPVRLKPGPGLGPDQGGALLQSEPPA